MASEKTRAGAQLFGSLEEIAAGVNAVLREAGVQLAVAETGTRGDLAALLRPSGVLTQARLFSTAEQLAVALRVSAAKVDAFGAISAMVAAEAAADLIDTYEGGWGLVVLVGNRDESADVQSTSGGAGGFVALGTPSTTIVQQSSPERIAKTVLELLRQQAQRRLALR